MVDEPDEIHLQREKKPTKNLGYTTHEALKVLCDEIETTVKSYETKFHNERFVSIKHCLCQYSVVNALMYVFVLNGA